MEFHTLRHLQFNKVFMEMAVTISQLSTCPRADVGAVLVRDRRVLTMGFNGAPIGTPHCKEAGCQMEDGRCVRSVHAEQNAIIQAALHGISTQGALLYCTHRPCLNCTKVLINAGIKSILFQNEYDSGSFAAHLLRIASIHVAQLTPQLSYDAHVQRQEALVKRNYVSTFTQQEP